MKNTTEAAKFAATFLIQLSVAIALVVVTLWMGPIIESKYMPVIEDVELMDLQSESEETISLKVIGNKVRACRYIETHALVFVNGSWEKGDITFSTSNSPATRPVGKQSFGVWTVRPNGHAVMFEVVHSCHFAWNTVTNMGVWERK